MIRVSSILAALLLGFPAIIGSASPSAAASPDLQALEGAWAQPPMTCDKIFAAGGKSVKFRRPVNIFSAAFILSGRRLTTPGATCQVRSIADVKGRAELTLSCATRVAIDTVKVQFSLSPDGALHRYTDEIDPSGSRYERCAPH